MADKQVSDTTLGMATLIGCRKCHEEENPVAMHVYVVDEDLYVVCADAEHRAESGPVLKIRLPEEFLATWKKPQMVVPQTA